MRMNAPRCTLGVVVVALFLAVTWSTTAARLSPTNVGAAVEPKTAVALTPTSLTFRPSVFYATVTTDKPGYVTGETVVVTGTGWQAGETVHLVYDETPYLHPPHEANTVADSNGNIFSAEFVIQPEDADSWFVLTATGMSSGLTAEARFSDAAGFVVDFRQGANNEKNGAVTGLGNIHWISSIIQSSNSEYFEGMGVFQRTIFTGTPTTTGDVHTLTFRHEFTKGGIHAYDFLVSYDQAIQNDQDALGVAIQLNPCGVEIGPPNTLAATCTGLRAASNPNKLDVTLPSDPFISKDGSTASRIAAYEALNGPRSVRIYGDAAISNASITVCHNVADGGDTGDSFALYTLKWTSSSSNILMEMAGHLAVSGDGTGDSWGATLGSSQISGGPYHFKLDQLGGDISNAATCPQTQSEVTSLGSQDNQIKGADILVPCPTCSVSGSTGPFCPGSDPQTYTVTVNGTCNSQSTITWTLSNNTSGATFNGGNTGSTVSVNPGSTCGSFTLTSSFTCSNCPDPVTCSISPSVQDTTPPVLTGCPTDTTVQCLSGVPSAATVTANDNCDGAITPTFSETQSNPGSSCNNVITRVWTATDRCGNTASCTQHITVNDTTAPVLTGCPTDTTVQCIGDVPAAATVTANDNCDGAITPTFSESQSNPGSSCNNVITRTWTATDACGNTASCTQHITVNDTTAPVLSGCPADTTVQCIGDVPAPANVTANDNCDGAITPTFSESQSNPGSSCDNVITRTWTATDRCGNAASCTQHITVNDTTPPVISCPSDRTFECDAIGAFGTATATDNCDPSPRVSFSDEVTPGRCAQERTITRTWTATDACGNHASCTQTIRIVDTTAPRIACPSDITVGSCHNVVTFSTVVSDNCDSTPSVVCVPPSGSAFSVGTTVVTCTATDACGNSSSCTFNVNVAAGPTCDITPPSQQPICGSTGNTLTSSVTGTGTTCAWSLDGDATAAGWVITSQSCSGVTYTAGAQASTAHFTLTVTDSFGCTTTCTVDVTCEAPQMEFCALTQGFYGNQGGKFGCDPDFLPDSCVGMSSTRIMTLLLTAPFGDLVVGKPGHSFTLRSANADSDAACIVKKLPANSTPTTLPPGDGVFTAGCNTSDNIPTGAGGRWLNVLLGQTITLSFNVRYDAFLHGGPPSGLGGLTICSTMVTQGSLVGPDGKPGTGDETIDPGPDGILGTADDPILAVSIPNDVMCALVNLGLPTTVNGLLELANRALGADPNLGGATIADINFAVNSINVGFDRCRFLISCTGGCVTGSLAKPTTGQLVAQAFPFERRPAASLLDMFAWNTTRFPFSSRPAALLDVEHNPTYFRFGL